MEPVYTFRKSVSYDLFIDYELIAKETNLYFSNEIEVIYVKKGMGTVLVNNYNIDLQPGSFHFFYPYHVRKIVPDNTNPLELVRCKFPLGLSLLAVDSVKSYLEVVENMQIKFSNIKLDRMDCEHIEYFIGEIDYEKRNTKGSHYLLDTSLVGYLSSMYAKYQDRSEYITIEDEAWQVLQFVHTYHQQEIDTMTISNTLNISTVEVNEAIERLTGFTLGETLNQVRIRNASALMQFSDLSCNQIGKICGYNTEANFYKQFKNVYGMTPQTYRDVRGQASDNSVELWEITGQLLDLCTQPLEMKEFCSITNYSKDKINSILFKNYNKTFNEVLNTYRVKIAQVYLNSTDLTITEISEKVGFSNSNSFCRWYKDIYKKTPSEYVRELHKKISINGDYNV